MSKDDLKQPCTAMRLSKLNFYLAAGSFMALSKKNKVIAPRFIQTVIMGMEIDYADEHHIFWDSNNLCSGFVLCRQIH